MSNDVMAILQPVKPHARTPDPGRSVVKPIVVAPTASPGTDRISLTDSARLLQSAEAKPGRTGGSRPMVVQNDMTYSPTSNGFRGKGIVTGPNGHSATREVSVAFDQAAQSVTREVTLTAPNGGEMSRSVERTRTEDGMHTVARRVGPRGNEVVRDTTVSFNSTTQRPDHSGTITAVPDGGMTGGPSVQKPHPALADMMNSFYSSSDSENFNAQSDLNGDGMVNFQDLAALKGKLTGNGMPAAPAAPEPHPAKADMMNSFFSSEGSDKFNGQSDLNGDGMVNFQDLAMLKGKLTENGMA